MNREENRGGLVGVALAVVFLWKLDMGYQGRGIEVGSRGINEMKQLAKYLRSIRLKLESNSSLTLDVGGSN